jgi:hypothetical protein
MSDLLKKIRLIRTFEFTFDLKKDDFVKFMKEKSFDQKVHVFQLIVGQRIPINSTDIVFSNDENEFKIIRESAINPSKGRAIIKGSIKQVGENQTKIFGEIISNFREIRIIPVFVTITVLPMLPFFYLNLMNWSFLIWLFIFFAILIGLWIIYLRYETFKVYQALTDFFMKIKK